MTENLQEFASQAIADAFDAGVKAGCKLHGELVAAVKRAFTELEAFTQGMGGSVKDEPLIVTELRALLEKCEEVEDD